MRFFKLGLISFLLLFLLITAISLLLPSTVHISRAIDISAPVDSVYANINDLAKWKRWFANYDSSVVTLSPHTTGAGATLTMNKTTVTIVESNDTTIRTIWKGGNKFLEGDFNLIKQKGSSQITVQWHFIQRVKWYPWEKFALIVSNKSIGLVMEQSLDNLKKILAQ